MKQAWACLAVCGGLVLGGCRSGPPPEFPLNLEGRDPQTLRLAQREAIVKALDRLFGTPDEPRAPDGSGLRLELLRRAAGPIQGDPVGNRFGLFRQHCVACHGLAGDGGGPAAAMLSPYPRDFRAGVFKYTRTAGGAKPVHDDLYRTLYQGVPGTAMPSQALLPRDEIEALIEYVKYLSIRGQTETYLMSLVIDEDAYLPLDLDEVLKEGMLPAAEAWRQAAALEVKPPPPPDTSTPEQFDASVELGRKLYANKDAQCVKCHGPDGAGDGEEKELYDDWNKRKKGVTAEETRRLARWFSLPIQQLRARNFREGVFHGGGRPIDLYWRVHVGIKGTPMPAAGPAPGSKGPLTPEQIWHVVNYVRHLAEKGR